MMTLSWIKASLLDKTKLEHDCKTSKKSNHLPLEYASSKTVAFTKERLKSALSSSSSKSSSFSSFLVSLGVVVTVFPFFFSFSLKTIHPACASAIFRANRRWTSTDSSLFGFFRAFVCLGSPSFVVVVSIVDAETCVKSVFRRFQLDERLEVVTRKQ